jgi:hypothetical protein
MPYASLSRAHNPKGPKPLVDSWHGAACACTTFNILSKAVPPWRKTLAGAKLFLAHMEFPDPNKGNSLPTRRAGAWVRMVQSRQWVAGGRKGSCRLGRGKPSQNVALSLLSFEGR